MQVVNKMRKRLFAVVAVSLVLGFVACSDLSGPDTDFYGAYELQTLNGFILPTVVYQDVTELDELLSETFRIYTDGSYTDDYTLRVSSSSGQSTVSRRDVGTYIRSGKALQFVDGNNGQSFDGEINGTTLTITQNNNVYVYRR